ncbi:MAG: MerR family transcriptional regulator [Fibromonadaceae bacterium]|jgi:DNA-binding transcriptional MerR regulator|nr:MerR family transcriptional regulator [Fibromonadaceae bacterium]
MKYGQIKTEKLYFSSSEAAEKVGVSVSVLHSWESLFPKLNPNKNGTGKRVYRLSDIEIAKQIKNEQTKETIFGEEAVAEAPPKTVKERSNTAKNKASKEYLLKIRDSLQSALNKIKK